MTGYKNWSTPAKQGRSLNTGGVRLQTGKGSAIGLGKGGMILNSRRDAILAGRNGMIVSQRANDPIYLVHGISFALSRKRATRAVTERHKGKKIAESGRKQLTDKFVCLTEKDGRILPG